jgi:hypothetical protein
MAKTSPTARTLKYLRDNGWPLVQVVERYNPFSKKRIDLFGFADVIAMGPTQGTALIQVTSGTNVAARITKMRDECYDQVLTAMKTPNVSVVVHGWRKVRICTQCGEMKFKKECQCKGSKHVARWKPHIINITEDILNATPEQQAK